MSQKNAHVKTEERCYRDMEERLTAYYGPALPPHALSEAAWLQVRAQLDVTRRVSSHERRVRWPGFARLRSKQTIPPNLRRVFVELLAQINYRRPQPVLRCSFNARLSQPHVQTSPLGRGHIQLALPERLTLQQIEVEVLLAAGLARCSGASRTLFVLPRTLLACGLLLVMAVLPLANVERKALWLLLAALACCLAGGCLLTWQKRAVALRADYQAVQWLGRERVCQGLHLLAKHGHVQHRPAWGEPSLVERIERICGTQTSIKDNHLTLVH